MSQSRWRIGVDLGGTKIEAVVLDPERDSPTVLARRRITTPREHGYNAIVEATHTLITHVARDAALPPLTNSNVKIGVGMPGSVTQRQSDGTRSDVPLVKNSNTTCLNGHPFRTDLRRIVGKPDIAFANDANCFALAEAAFGAARGARVVFGVILGTGVGGGIVWRDPNSRESVMRAWEGAHGIAGEWGHVVIDAEGGPPCYCGRRGCVETYLAGPAIEREYALRTGVERSLVDIAARAKVGEDAATTLLSRTMERFGQALSTVVNILDPDVIVLGGGVSNLEPLYDEGRAALGRWIFNDVLTTRVVKNELGDSAGVLGAALL